MATDTASAPRPTTPDNRAALRRWSADGFGPLDSSGHGVFTSVDAPPATLTVSSGRGGHGSAPVVVSGGALTADSEVAYMLDQCHNIEKKIPGQIRSVLNVQEMAARALLVDTDALRAAQEDGDVLLANEVFMDAFYTDVRRDLAAWREQRGIPADPMRAYLASGYQEQIEADRVGGTQAGWN